MTERDRPIVVQRCAPDGTICPEVELRLEAGHRTKYVEGCAHHGEEMIVKAARIAALHREENQLRGEAG